MVVSSVIENDEQEMVTELSLPHNDCNVIFLANLETSSVQGCFPLHAFLNIMKI